MSDHSHIQWTDATLNVVTGCTKVSEGCESCYIERTPPFRVARRRFDKPGIGGSTGVILHPDRMDLPLKWRQPRRVFVNSLSDLFHEDVPDDFIECLWDVMGATPQHQYQILTKRPARMRSLMRRWTDRVETYRARRTGLLDSHTSPPIDVEYDAWPPLNIWLGVSVEDQKWADIRIQHLLDTPAAVRFLSCEPLLGPLDLTGYLPHLSWVILGGESGPGARPMAEEWAYGIVQQCRAANVPVFVKQMGRRWAEDHGSARTDAKGADLPDHLNIREFPATPVAVA